MNLFTAENTDGYSQVELDTLSNEWEALAASLNLEEYTPEYSDEAKIFSDAVARR